MTIGDRIKQVRKALNYTQQRFADELGLKQNTVATYEMNKTTPSERTIMDISSKLNVNRRWLETGEGEMFNSLDREKEIALFFRQISKQPNSDVDEFKRNLIVALAKLDEGAWEVLAQIAADLAAENEKNGE